MLNLQPARYMLLACFVSTCALAKSQGVTVAPGNDNQLDLQTAGQWADLVLKGLNTEYPNKLSLVYSSRSQIKTPREHFPAFYGCFDWHSSVHGHWVLVKLLRSYPTISPASKIRTTLNEHLTKINIEKESQFFSQPEQKTFERMYGWAWYLRLVIELDSWDDPDALKWRDNLRPLEELLVKRIKEYLPNLSYPIRTGQHPDTGFALTQILDYAHQIGDPLLSAQVQSRAKNFYYNDVNYPVTYEPSGHDFFSSCWNEADLMRRLLPQEEFSEWLNRFLPQLSSQLADGTISPVIVSDVTDPKIVHLAGLNLNRAWCLQSVAAALPQQSPLREPLRESSRKHLTAGLKYINSGHYEGDHWLATFGLYAVKRVGVRNDGE